MSVTTVPLVKFAEHANPQFTPVGELITVPVPGPSSDTFSANCGSGAGANVAVTLWLDVGVKVQVAVPVQAPSQPVKIEPGAGLAARLTCVPDVNVAEHVDPQLIPAGELVTVPLPVPARETETVT